MRGKIETLFNKPWLFIKLFKFVGFWESLPVKWDFRTQHLVPNFITSKLTLTWKLKILMLSTILHIFQNIYWVLINKNISVVGRIQNGISIAAFMAFSTHLFTTLDKGSEIILYINGLFQFLRRFPTGLKVRRSLVELLNILFCYGASTSAVVLPPMFIYGLHSIHLCRPSLFGYFFLDECREENVTTWKSVLFKLGVFLGNHFIWSFGFQATIFVIIMIMVLGTLILLDCLKIFWIQFSKAKSTVSRNEAMKLYREVQILGNLCNDIQQKIMVTSLVLIGIVIHAFTFSSFVRLIGHTELDLSIRLMSLMMFGMLAADTLVVIVVVFGGMSMLHKKSCFIIQDVRQLLHDSQISNLTSTERKCYLKWIKSCSIVKIKFGTVNFIEELTPLNLLSCSHGLSIQLLLLK